MNKSKNILIKMLGMTVLKTIETRVQCADKGKDEDMRNKAQYEAKAENE